MIGFSQELQQYKTDEAEGLDTKSLSKNELYDLVSADYMLPPSHSKGVTREYLLDVKDKRVFRVSNMEHKQFEFNLQKIHQKKVGIVNNSLLVKKLNILLKDRGEVPLGFTEFNLPEQNWLYKVARYIDQTNLLEFFEAAPCPEPPLSHISSSISKIYYGRLYASEYLFSSEKTKKNKKLWDAFSLLSEKYRTLNAYKIHVDVLENELRDTKRKVGFLETDLADMIGKVSFTYTGIEDPNITPELVIAGGPGLTHEMRNKLNTNAHL